MGEPIDDFNRFCREQEQRLSQLPVCYWCENPITDDFYYDIDGECLCENCLNDRYRKYNADL